MARHLTTAESQAVAQRQWTIPEVTKCLTTLAYCNGEIERARGLLEDTQNIVIRPDTLKHWRDIAYQDLYMRIAHEYATKLEALVIQETRELAAMAARAERLAIEQTEAALTEGRVAGKDASKIAADMSKVKTTNIEKLLALTGRPTNITETRTAADLLRSLEAAGVARRVDAEATSVDE